MASLDTRSVHAGEPHPRIEGAVTLPVFQTATYTHETPEQPPRYIRYSDSPNHDALHNKLAALAGTDDALVTASGMAAISTALLSVLDAGDHLVAPRGLYGGTLALFDTWTQTIAGPGRRPCSPIRRPSTQSPSPILCWPCAIWR